MNKKVRWGIVACGGIAARRTIPEYLKMPSGGDITAVMDLDVKRAREVAKKFNIPRVYETEKELLLDKEIDAVYIASPQNDHCAQVVRAAQAGKHILCEKPVAISLEEVDQMEAACKKAKIKFMLGFCLRNNMYNKKARELVQAGALGQIVMGRAQMTCWYPPIEGAWRQDIALSHGGALIDMGTHCLDLLEWIMKAMIVEVTGFHDLLVHKYRTRIEDTSTIVARFSNGAHGIIDNYFNLPDAAAQNSMELYGTKGCIIGQGTIGQDPTGKMFSIIQEKETDYAANQVRNVEVKRQEYHLEGLSLYGQMMNIFNDCVLTNKEPPVTIEEGRHSVKVVNAIYESTRSGRAVKVQP